MIAATSMLTPTPTPIAALSIAMAPAAPCSANLYDIPGIHPACAMSKSSAYSTLMSSCCGAAPVLSNSYSYYCLALDQTVHDLARCLIECSRCGYVWCNADANQSTAEATDASITLSPSLLPTDLESGSDSTSSAAGTEIAPMDEELFDSVNLNGVHEQPVSVMNALLLLLMVLGGVMRIAP
ncbi:hypothetical protein BDV06DRAFT_224611 [Aspergillus oleicola]